MMLSQTWLVMQHEIAGTPQLDEPAYIKVEAVHKVSIRLNWQLRKFQPTYW